MTTTLVVVAHRTGARLLTRTEAKGSLTLLEELEHPEGRERNIDRDADRPGRTHNAAGTRHALEREEMPHEKAAHDFALLLADRVRHLRNDHRFDDAVLVAEPDFLGMLRGALDDVTAKTVTGSIHKDLAKVETRDLAKHLEG